ncbi:hypothetical protein ACFOQM_10840 [Paenibacillus sp. GCM10012307]|uniref:Uncharacterized protein n=1 Tax=Paenibacillus roseus TaxID=2798579 RepID=A0A934MV63_9BACL|nr:hypothetical protein [Paenibacillus roseus]MBJ6361782.1 hypothetical protein [Paenibacillus roseus]
MRRSILGLSTRIDTSLEVAARQQATVRLDGVALEKRLRLVRSSSFVEEMTKLDVSGTAATKEKVQELINKIAIEFPELAADQLPLGIVSKCYLGDPYEVHSLDARLAILEHYKRGEIVPNGMEKARKLAMHPGYAYIEVFKDKICAVSKSGQVSFIKE